MLGHEQAGLSRADDQRTVVAQVTERMLDHVHRDAGDGEAPPAKLGLAADALPGLEGVLAERTEVVPLE